MYKTKLLLTLTCLLLVGFSTAALALTDEEKLGQRLYFDQYLSLNQNQSCASCHLPSTGFVDPENVLDPVNSVVSLGSDTSLNGGRNAPTSGYAAFIPEFGGNSDIGYYGGQFWDGRENTLQEQAKGPFRNPVEMGMADADAVVGAVADPLNKNYKFYENLFASVYGIDLTSYADAGTVFEFVAQAIAVFEQSCRFHKFSSNYDYSLSGQVTLTDEEKNGQELFKAHCATCHSHEPTGNVLPLFSNYKYYNLGIPKSENGLIIDFAVDLGLGGGQNTKVPVDDRPAEYGKFRVPSLRNIADTPPYGHNGYFSTLEKMVHFINTGEDDISVVAVPEVGDNLYRIDGGSGIGADLSPEEEGYVVAFLRTLSDGDTCQLPTGYVMPKMTDLPDLGSVTPIPVSPGSGNQWGK